jgi:hypothetical protein
VEQLKIRSAGADKLHGGFDFKAISEILLYGCGFDQRKSSTKIGEWTPRMGTNHINSVLHVADMPHWKAVKKHHALRGRSHASFAKRRCAVSRFVREEKTIDGVKTVVHSAAGSGRTTCAIPRRRHCRWLRLCRTLD